jgi:hypothetical protein
LLGPETGPSGLPCAISVPNLNSDRGLWFAGFAVALNVRRLMYQSLIWAGALRNDACGLAAALYTEDMQRPPNALVYGVWRDIELARNLFG